MIYCSWKLWNGNSPKGMFLCIPRTDIHRNPHLKKKKYKNPLHWKIICQSLMFLTFFPLLTFLLCLQRGEEWAAFGHQAGAWEHGGWAQETSARGNVSTDVHACAPTCTHNTQTFTNMSPPPAPCASKSSVCAALPGFNQSAGDLAHYRLLELSLVKQQPHMAFDREWATGWLVNCSKQGAWG